MTVIRANVLGFCMGVRRAVELANAQALRMEQSGGEVFTLGPLIHNPRVLADLRGRGIAVLDEQNLPASLAGATVIIRAHGVPPQTEAELRKRGARVIDATCPKVKASQLTAQTLAQAGRRLFLAGEASHAEIAGIVGYARRGYGSPDKAQKLLQVASSVPEAAAAAKHAAADCAVTQSNAAALIGQTTISAEEYRSIGEAVQKYFPNLEIVQTICAATVDRQNALRDLLERADAVIVAGGKESANTRRLLAIAQESGKPCALAESAADIPGTLASIRDAASIRSAACRTIGICAGASTPDFVIDEIEAALGRL